MAGLAVAALGDVVFAPGFLQRMRAVGGESFDGGDGNADDRGNGQHARAGGDAVEVDGARAALADAAAVLGADEAKVITQDPEQRGVGWAIDGVGLLVDEKLVGHRRRREVGGMRREVGFF